jgi:hypothetical protein
MSDGPKVRLFPNPATTSLQVEWNEQLKPASIVIVNGITGKQMISTSISNAPLRINVSNYVPGIYVFRMFSSTGTYLGGATFQVSK